MKLKVKIKSPYEIKITSKGDWFDLKYICQFRIQLSQKATVLQKLKWLFSSGIKFIYVDKLENKNRGGIGSTGK